MGLAAKLVSARILQEGDQVWGCQQLTFGVWPGIADQQTWGFNMIQASQPMSATGSSEQEFFVNNGNLVVGFLTMQAGLRRASN